MKLTSEQFLELQQIMSRFDIVSSVEIDCNNCGDISVQFDCIVNSVIGQFKTWLSTGEMIEEQNNSQS